MSFDGYQFFSLESFRKLKAFIFFTTVSPDLSINSNVILLEISLWYRLKTLPIITSFNSLRAEWVFASYGVYTCANLYKLSIANEPTFSISAPTGM